jgi:methionine-rich copper-binding protein CopC
MVLIPTRAEYSSRSADPAQTARMKESPMRNGFALATLGALGALAIATEASAHVALVKATPAANAAGAAPTAIQLQFSGKVEPKFSAFDLLKADGSKIPVVAGPAAPDGRAISGTVGHPLTPGVYKVAWRIVSADGHRMTGAYNFTVR